MSYLACLQVIRTRHCWHSGQPKLAAAPPAPVRSQCSAGGTQRGGTCWHSGQLKLAAGSTAACVLPTQRGWNQSSHASHCTMYASGLYGSSHTQYLRARDPSRAAPHTPADGGACRALPRAWPPPHAPVLWVHAELLQAGERAAECQVTPCMRQRRRRKPGGALLMGPHACKFTSSLPRKESRQSQWPVMQCSGSACDCQFSSQRRGRSISASSAYRRLPGAQAASGARTRGRGPAGIRASTAARARGAGGQQACPLRPRGGARVQPTDSRSPSSPSSPSSARTLYVKRVK